jgi:hypothetical protein
MPCAYCGRADGVVYQMNDLRRGTRFNPASGAPIDCPSVYLHEGCSQAYFSNGRDEAPLSRWQVRDLVGWYCESYRDRQDTGGVDEDELQAELREKLVAEVPPELVEAAFAQVMDAVFRV